MAFTSHHRVSCKLPPLLAVVADITFLLDCEYHVRLLMRTFPTFRLPWCCVVKLSKRVGHLSREGHAHRGV